MYCSGTSKWMPVLDLQEEQNWRWYHVWSTHVINRWMIQWKMARVVSSAAVTPNPAACATWQAWQAWTRVKPVCAIKLEVMNVWQQWRHLHKPFEGLGIDMGVWPIADHSFWKIIQFIIIQPLEESGVIPPNQQPQCDAMSIDDGVSLDECGSEPMLLGQAPDASCRATIKSLLHPWYIVAVGAVYVCRQSYMGDIPSSPIFLSCLFIHKPQWSQ